MTWTFAERGDARRAVVASSRRKRSSTVSSGQAGGPAGAGMKSRYASTSWMMLGKWNLSASPLPVALCDCLAVGVAVRAENCFSWVKTIF